MSGRSELARPGRDREGGFSLIEVVVAVALLAMVLVAVLPELVVGVRATAGAKNLTQAKGVLQARLETMRSMPYHVGPAAGDYVDLLDTYYRDLAGPTAASVGCPSSGLVAAPQLNWTGFVSSANTARCGYEPQTGAFYRKVLPGITAPGLGTFTLVVDSAFLNSAVPPVPVTPATGYASQTAGKDTPGSLLLGVWATVVYRQSSALKPVTTYTQVTARSPASSSLEVAATVNTVRVASQSATSLITLDAGVVAQAGTRFTGSSVHTNANAFSTGMSTGASAEGAKATLAAPPTTAQPFTLTVAGSLPGGCTYVCFGGSSVEGASVSASDGLPLSAAPDAPVRVAALAEGLRPGHRLAQYGGFWFNNDPDDSGPVFDKGLLRGHPIVSLDATEPGQSFVQSDCADTGAVAPSNLFSATGFLYADPVTVGTPVIRACVTSRSAPVMLFPTDWAPGGVIRVTLDQSSLQCKVTRTLGVRSAVAKAKFSATVEYWDEGGSRYVTAGRVTEASTSDPLEGVSLDTIVHGSGSGALKLSDFIQSWRASTAGDVAVSMPSGPDVPLGSAIRAKVPGVVSIDSQPTRVGDASSVVSVTIGTFTCDAKDVR